MAADRQVGLRCKEEILFWRDCAGGRLDGNQKWWGMCGFYKTLCKPTLLKYSRKLYNQHRFFVLLYFLALLSQYFFKMCFQVAELYATQYRGQCSKALGHLYCLAKWLQDHYRTRLGYFPICTMESVSLTVHLIDLKIKTESVHGASWISKDTQSELLANAPGGNKTPRR